MFLANSRHDKAVDGALLVIRSEMCVTHRHLNRSMSHQLCHGSQVHTSRRYSAGEPVAIAMPSVVLDFASCITGSTSLVSPQLATVRVDEDPPRIVVSSSRAAAQIMSLDDIEREAMSNNPAVRLAEDRVAITKAKVPSPGAL
jgi:hypothetical protein